MKKTLFLLLAMGLLPMAQSVAVAETDEQHSEQAAPNVRVSRDGLLKGDTIRISYSEPMVAESEVGKPAKPEQLPTISPALEAEAVWDSTSSLALKLKADAERRRAYKLELPEGLVSVNGQAMPGGSAFFARNGYVWVSSAHDGEKPGSPIFFAGSDEDDDAAIAAAVDKAYALRKVGGVDVERFPVKVRPATTADALAHWNSYVELSSISLGENDRKAFAEAAPDTVLPHIWLAEGLQADRPDERLVLMLPGLGSFDADTGTFEDKGIASCSLRDYNMALTAERSGEGQYRLTLEPGQPLAECDPAKAFEGTQWFITRIDGKEMEAPVLLEPKDGALRPEPAAVEANPELAAVVLTPDLAATAATLEQRTLRTGETLSGLRQLILKAEVGKLRLDLRCLPSLSSVYGEAPSPDWNSEKSYNWIATTLLPERPTLFCSVMSSGLNSEGKRLIRYRTSHVSKVTARVFRVDAQGMAAARLLRAYSKQYMRQRHQDGDEWTKVDGHPLPDTTLFDTESLLFEAVERELPPAESEGSFDPATFFEGQPRHGVYLVELVGTPDATEWGTWRVVAQGLVQMTNVGLMWKRGEHGLFAYAYHLSDATPVAEGTLHVLNAEGRVMATLPVAEGIARGGLPEGAAFLQLRVGEDAYTTRVARDDDRLYNGYGTDCYLRSLGINPNEFPQTSVYMFSDRSAYRPGETINLKGIVRHITGDDVSVPRVKSLTMKLNAGGVRKEIPVAVEADGTFSLSLPLEGCAPDNHAIVYPVICFEGDEAGEAPDQVFLRQRGVDPDEAHYLLESNRETDAFSFRIADFRRNEFELDGSIRHADGSVSMDVSAMAFTGLPVSHGEVQWTLERYRARFAPDQHPDYRFGDERNGSSWFFSSDDDDDSGFTLRRHDALDAQGRGTVEFELPEEEFPGRREVAISASVTNGNEQTLRCTRCTTVDASAVYAGLRVSGRLTEAQDAIPVDAILVRSDEQDYTGEPIRCEVTATRRIFRSYRYGAESLNAVRNAPEESQVYSGELMVGGEPAHVDIPTSGPGIYDIILRGKDADGKPFASARRQYVWGGSGISPWSYEDGDELSLVADQESYQPGDTARILVQTPVDAELLVTVERAGVRRDFKRSVTVDKPVIDIPIEAGDGPMSYISVFLVQKETGRAATGLPLIKSGTVAIKVEMPEKRLGVTFDLPDSTPLAGKEWTIGGSVKGADGKPVANASVAVYAVDEGTLQVVGYTLPDPYDHFYGERPCGVSTYTTNGQLVSDSLDADDFGNKGVFIGGGGGSRRKTDSTPPRTRENFAPCALWLGNARTDAEGRFTATYAQPDTMTRYRLMAVAAEDDRFGSAETAYSVVQPVMLEPAVPTTAAAGDTLDLPVTLSMLPDALPGGRRDEVAWTISLAGENADIGEATRTVTVHGTEPTTITLPVTLNNVGDTRLTWTVKAEDPALADVADAVALGFRIVPPTPYLRERFFATLKSGSTAEPTNWFKAKLRPDGRMEATISTSPLVGATAGCDFLFRYPYGCLEQTASTLLPWFFQQQLEQELEVSFPQGKERGKVIAEGIRSLLVRRRADGHFSYWDRGAAASEFSAYALLVLGYADPAMLSGVQKSQIRQSLVALKRHMEGSADASLLGLITLARAGELTEKEFDLIMQLHEHPHADEAWVVALAARLIKHPQADKLLADARQGKVTDCGRFMMPPMAACRVLDRVLREPGADDTATALRDYVAHGVEKGRFLSTWEAGWLCLVLHEYLDRRPAGEATATRLANGIEVSPGNPLRLDTLLGEAPKLPIRNGNLYASGIAEGYERDVQPNRLIDKGFRVERRYERLMEDGSWQPTAEFTVGDVVRVTLSAKGQLGSYMLVEDRLPAAFETINPALPSQSLPPAIVARVNECWHVPGWIDHTEYEQARVRFFASSWFGGEPLTVSYVARVVRSGQVTAPAARAEFMYRPQVYGLSVPQAFTVKPRP